MAEEEIDTTVIQVRKQTAIRIKAHAEFGDSYDSILTRVFDALDLTEKKKK